MQSNERTDLILKIVRKRGSIKVSDLIKLIPASAATIRRDINKLASSSAIKHKHGIVSYKDNSNDFIIFDMRKNIYDEEKKEIGRLASTLVREGETIIIDGSSTALALARQLTGRKSLSVITNSLPVALVLANTAVKVFVTGGLLQDTSLLDYDAEKYFESKRVDIAFIGATGVRGTEGITSISPFHAAIRRQMIRCANRVYVLLDSSKFTLTGVDLAVNFSEITGIITTKPIQSKELLTRLNELGTEIYYTE